MVLERTHTKIVGKPAASVMPIVQQAYPGKQVKLIVRAKWEVAKTQAYNDFRKGDGIVYLYTTPPSDKSRVIALSDPKGNFIDSWLDDY